MEINVEGCYKTGRGLETGWGEGVARVLFFTQLAAGVGLRF